jgi:GNAT superfamily N-acetyltransferase
MDDIIIRKVKPEDAEQYLKLVCYVWRDAYKHIFPEEVFIERESLVPERVKSFDENFYNDNTKLVYVAEDDGKIVGVIMARIDSGYEYFDKLGYADLEALYIHPDYQGKGIGSKFKKIFVDWLKENKATKYVIGVLKENTNARKVYEAWGGKLDEYNQPFVKLGVPYDEVFYTYIVE